MNISLTRQWACILHDAGRRLGRPDILFWTLPWLMILIIAGTVAQKYMGLYAAQNMFFSSFVFFVRGVPLPGGYTVLTLLTVNLVCKFIFQSEWTRDKYGIHLIHLSVILLMAGGLMTALSAREGFIALKEGESGMVVRDYYDRVLLLEETGHKERESRRHTVSFDRLEKGQKIDLPSLPFDIVVMDICENSMIRPRADMGGNDGIGAASMAQIHCVKPFLEKEQNISGLTYRVTNAADTAQNGIYIAFEGRQTDDIISDYAVRVERDMRALPFTVTLNNFRRDVYPGTLMARDYESRVTITDGDVSWPAIITMNEPLRYKGYTFYQASTLIGRDGKAVSVLSVVTNTGWIFPYVAGILLAAGLILHIIIRLRGGRQ